MKLSLIIILLLTWTFGFAQQEQRKATKYDEIVVPTPTTEKGSGQVRTFKATSYGELAPSTNAPVDTVRVKKSTQRKPQPINYNEIVKPEDYNEKVK